MSSSIRTLPRLWWASASLGSSSMARFSSAMASYRGRERPPPCRRGRSARRFAGGLVIRQAFEDSDRYDWRPKRDPDVDGFCPTPGQGDQPMRSPCGSACRLERPVSGRRGDWPAPERGRRAPALRQTPVGPPPRTDSPQSRCVMTYFTRALLRTRAWATGPRCGLRPWCGASGAQRRLPRIGAAFRPQRRGRPYLR